MRSTSSVLQNKANNRDLNTWSVMPQNINLGSY